MSKWCSNVLVLYASDPDAYPDIPGCDLTWKQRMDQVVAMLGLNGLATCSMDGFVRRLWEAGLLNKWHCNATYECQQLWKEFLRSILGITANCLVPWTWLAAARELGLLRERSVGEYTEVIGFSQADMEAADRDADRILRGMPLPSLLGSGSAGRPRPQFSAP